MRNTAHARPDLFVSGAKSYVSSGERLRYSRCGQCKNRKGRAGQAGAALSGQCGAGMGGIGQNEAKQAGQSKRAGESQVQNAQTSAGGTQSTRIADRCAGCKTTRNGQNRHEYSTCRKVPKPKHSVGSGQAQAISRKGTEQTPKHKGKAHTQITVGRNSVLFPRRSRRYLPRVAGC